MVVFLLFFFIAGHALMDFALQGDAIATCKNRKANHPLQKFVPWWYWMTAHALLQGLIVGVVVQWAGYSRETAAWYGLAETVVHMIIDIIKCEGYTNIHHDQFLHIACKVLWTVLLVNGVVLT
jgi:hypothetical protein